MLDEIIKKTPARTSGFLHLSSMFEHNKPTVLKYNIDFFVETERYQKIK